MYQKIDQFMKRVESDDADRFLGGIDFVINGFGRFEQGNVGEIRSFIVSDYELIYIRSGVTQLDWGGGSAEGGSGAFILLEPYHEYSARTVSEEKLYYFYIHFDIRQEYLREIYYNRMLNGEGPVFATENLEYVAPVLARVLEDRIAGREGLNTVLNGLMRMFSVHMMRQRGACGVWDEGMEKQGVNCITGVQRIVEENNYRSVSVGQLCRELGTSESYLYKLFKRTLNQSPSRFIMLLRLKKAAQMIKLDGCSVTDAAAALGYSSPAHLSSQFKKMLGVSPTELLKKSADI